MDSILFALLLSSCGGDGADPVQNCATAFEDSPLWSFEWNVDGVTDDNGEVVTLQLDVASEGENVVYCNSSAILVDGVWVYTYECPSEDVAGRASLEGDELTVVVDAGGEVGEVRFVGTLNGTCDELRGTSMAVGTSGTLIGIPAPE